MIRAIVRTRDRLCVCDDMNMFVNYY